MSKIDIGTNGHHRVSFDIAELLVSRLLVQANSGGGKSFLLRRLLEQGFGKVQEIVIDVAGEFSTLREKYGFVLVGEHGETPADIRSAGLVAQKLLELRASAVCDLYSLKPQERHTWVRLFLEAVMNAPKRLWHPVIFVVDEAHKFCPEKGEGESEAKEMMLSLASDGRKYGFCAVYATQRLSKLDKSAASELTNVLIGPTFIDIDLQRAHKALGIVQRDQALFNEQMKTVAPGHFWALGRAISKTRVLVKIGSIETTHPSAGSGKYSAAPAPMPEKIKALLPQLADLPKEAEEKARTEAEFRREIRSLTLRLAAAEKAKPAIAAPTHKTEDHPAKLQQQMARELIRRDALWNASVVSFRKRMQNEFAAVAKVVAEQLRTAIQQGISIDFVPPAAATPAAAAELVAQKLLELRASAVCDPAEPVRRELVALKDIPPFEHKSAPANGTVKLGAMNLRIAGILAGYYPEPVKVSILAAMCGASMGGTFSARLSECRSAGLLEDPARGYVRATELCSREYLGKFQAPTTTEEMMALWEPKWGKANREIMRFLVDRGGEPVSKEELAASVGMAMGGTFSARLSEVRSSGLLVEPGRGMIAANKEAMFLAA